jgi:solute carrier family 45, member 1/2/4
LACSDDGKGGALKALAQIFRTVLHLPARIQAICWAQFWAWIGWFPYLFYSATWVGEIWRRYEAPASSADSKDALGDIGRIGSLSLVVFSIITFLSSVFLPFVVQSPEDYENYSSSGRLVSPHRPPPTHLPPWLEKLSVYKPDLVSAWLISHLIFASAMVFAPFITSLHGATLLVALCGIPWAVSCWAPFAFMGVEINRLGGSTTFANGHAYSRFSVDSIELEEAVPSSPTTLRLNHNSSEAPSSTGELAGIYLGVLNVYTTLPQFVGTFISMIVFSLLEPGKSPELADDKGKQSGKAGLNAIAVCLFIGALSALVAAVATRRLKYTR